MANDKDETQSNESAASQPSAGGKPAETTGSSPEKPSAASASVASGGPAKPSAGASARPGGVGGRGRGGPGRGGPGRGGPGRGGPGRGGDRRGGRNEDPDGKQEEQRVVKINRCATVVKGGRRFSFSALVVVGDGEGSVGIGFGKANEVPPSVEKAFKDARKNVKKVSLKGNTIPHHIVGRFLSSKVVLVPASEGTGVIAGASVRAVVECAGIKNVLTKIYGSANPLNVVKATMVALESLRTREEVARLRGIELEASK